MILEGSSESWGTPNTDICEEFVRFSVCLEQVHFFVFFFVPLHSECFWKHFKSLFGPKACLGMVRGGLWGKECAPKSFECPVRDRKSSILNRGDFPGIAPELIKIDVLVIGVLFEKLKLEMLNTGPNGAPGGPAGVPGRPGAPFWVPRSDLEG